MMSNNGLDQRQDSDAIGDKTLQIQHIKKPTHFNLLHLLCTKQQKQKCVSL